MYDERKLPKRAPDLQGFGAKVWRIRDTSVYPALIASWIVYAPHSHPFWPAVMVSVGHLRQLEGGEPVKLYLEGATHEIVVEAIEPNWQLTGEDAVIRTLSPTNFCAQFVADSDAAAIDRVVVDAIAKILSGSLSPDSDYLQAWTALFGDNMVRK